MGEWVTGVEMQQMYPQPQTQTRTYIQTHKLLENVELDGDELSGTVTQQDGLLLAPSMQSSICS